MTERAVVDLKRGRGKQRRTDIVDVLRDMLMLRENNN